MIDIAQVRKILELVQRKGVQACEYFLYILYKVYDAYIDLQPWLKEINYQPPDFVRDIPVKNTDPSKYVSKLYGAALHMCYWNFK